jgi:hypothetical protein
MPAPPRPPPDKHVLHWPCQAMELLGSALATADQLLHDTAPAWRAAAAEARSWARAFQLGEAATRLALARLRALLAASAMPPGSLVLSGQELEGLVRLARAEVRLGRRGANRLDARAAPTSTQALLPTRSLYVLHLAFRLGSRATRRCSCMGRRAAARSTTASPACASCWRSWSG